jgi:hypothetical protein
VQIEMSDEEAEYVGDIMQMWAEGVEEEIPGLATMPQPDVHWCRFQLRKQLLVARTVKQRIDMERMKV